MKHYIIHLLIALLLPLGHTAFSQALVPVDTLGSGTIFFEDFESGGVSWTASPGFEIGVPTSGPGTAYAGSNVAATILNGNYSNSMTYSLTSGTVALPSTASNITLSFYEYHYTESSFDFTYVQVSTDGTNWTTLLGGRSGNFGGYNLQNISLNAYAGQTIQVRFYFTTDGSVVYPGWYLDNVAIDVVGLPNLTRDVPTLYLYDETELLRNDTTLYNRYYSTLQSISGDFVLANFGRDTLLIIDTIYTSTTGLVVSQAAEDSIPTAFGTPISYTYQPLAVGLVSDTLFIVSNDTASPFMIVFEGEAVDAPLEVIPELSLDGVIIGTDNFFNPRMIVDTSLIPETSANVYIDLALTNKGMVPLDVSNYYFKYGGNNAFWVYSWSSTLIEYGDTAIVTIGFGANRSRQQVFGLTYEFDNRDGETVSQTHWMAAQSMFDGTYLEIDGPWFSAGPDSLVVDFGTINVGTTAYQNYIWLKNLGSVPLNITMEIVGNDFSFVGENPINLNPGQGNSEGEEGIIFTPSDSTGITHGLLIFHHNDTTAGRTDTIYLRGKGFIPEVVNPPVFTLYYQGMPVDRDVYLEIDMGTAIRNNDFTEVDLMVVNSGETGGYIDWNYVGNYFYWIDDEGATYSSLSNIYIPAGDTLNFGIMFDPDYGYLFEEWTEIYFEDVYNWAYIHLQGAGIERHAFNLHYYGSNDVNEYNNYYFYNYEGYSESVTFEYTNLHESAVTIDSVTISDNDATTMLNAAGLPVILAPGESYAYNTIFDPTVPDGRHDATIKIYSTNLVEPVFVYYLANIANGQAAFEVEFVEGEANFNYGYLNFGEVSMVDGSKTASLRILSQNGYNVVIDSSRFYLNTPGLFTDLQDNLIIPAGDSADFSINFTPRTYPGYLSDELYMYYKYSDYPYIYAYSYSLITTGRAVPERTQAANLIVVAGSEHIAHNGLLDFGEIPMNNGLENILISLENSGVQYLTIDSIVFSNAAFSILEWDEMYDEFEIWYDEPSMLVVYFNPATADVETGTMTIYSDDPVNPAYVVNLNGTGTTGTSNTSITQSRVFPNPGSETIFVVTAFEDPSMVQIFNSAGKLVYQDWNTNGQVIDISTFEKGFYLVRVSNNSDTQQHKLIVE